MPEWVGIFIAVALIIGIVLLFRRAGSTGSLEEELLSLCLGDRTLMKRLIALEKNRSAGRAHKEAVKAAIIRLKRDNR